jgi:predicted RNA binding protein YcfA (HicA-like mRNA interferase family)
LKELKPIAPEKLLKILESQGFQPVRQKGSHVFVRGPEGQTTVIPVHAGEKIGRGLLEKILRDLDISHDDFLRFL